MARIIWSLVAFGVVVAVALLVWSSGKEAPSGFTAESRESPAAETSAASASPVPSVDVQAESSVGRDESVPLRILSRDPESRSQTVSPDLPVSRPQRAARFEAEPIDPQWAPGVESLIYSHVAQAGLDLGGVEAQCRSSTCRLTLTYFDPAATFADLQPRSEEIRAMTTRMIEEGRPDVQSVNIQVESGTDHGAWTATVYVNRQGVMSSTDARLPREIPECVSTGSCQEHFAIQAERFRDSESPQQSVR